MILLDTDIASALAKAGGLDLVLELFNKQVHITPKVYEELQASVGYGYVFPQEIFKKIRVLDVTPEEQRRYRNMLRRHMTLGKGELESVSVAVERGCLFSSLDKRAVKFAQKKRVTVVVLKVILKGLWKKGICTKKEVKELVDRIEKEDNRTIDTVGVFNE